MGRVESGAQGAHLGDRLPFGAVEEGKAVAPSAKKARTACQRKSGESAAPSNCSAPPAAPNGA
jgi:hypothetical protein